MLAAADHAFEALWFRSHLTSVREAAPLLSGLPAESLVVDGRARWLGFLGELPLPGLSVFGLWQLWRLFGHDGAGRCFAPVAQMHLRRFAWDQLGTSVLTPLRSVWPSLAFSAGAPPGQRMLALNVTTPDVFLPVLTSAALLAIAIVLSDAARIAEENQLFI